jgi:hypothetical protein
VIQRAAHGIWEFVVGDDWRVALWVVVTIAATAAIAAVGWPAWWLAPAATLAILRDSVRRGSQTLSAGEPEREARR